MKKIIVMSLLLIVLCGSFALVGCTLNGNQALSYVQVSINPDVELTVDGKNKVTAVNTLNEDADLLLSDKNIVGMNVAEAVEIITDLSINVNFMDIDASQEAVENQGKNNVEITVISSDEKTENKLKKTLADKIYKYFSNNGINGKVSQNTLDQYAKEVASWGVSAGRAKLILRAMDMNPELELEIVKTMSVKELITLTRDEIKKNNYNCQLRKEYKQKVNELKAQNLSKEELNEKLSTLKSEYDEKSVAAKAEFKEKKQNKINENKSKVDNHKKQHGKK